MGGERREAWDLRRPLDDPQPPVNFGQNFPTIQTLDTCNISQTLKEKVPHQRSLEPNDLFLILLIFKITEILMKSHLRLREAR